MIQSVISRIAGAMALGLASTASNAYYVTFNEASASSLTVTTDIPGMVFAVTPVAGENDHWKVTWSFNDTTTGPNLNTAAVTAGITYLSWQWPEPDGGTAKFNRVEFILGANYERSFDVFSDADQANLAYGGTSANADAAVTEFITFAHFETNPDGTVKYNPAGKPNTLYDGVSVSFADAGDSAATGSVPEPSVASLVAFSLFILGLSRRARACNPVCD